MELTNVEKVILIVHNYYQIPGGEDTVVANEKRMLEKHGYKVILYSRDNSEYKYMTKIQKLILPFATVFNIRTFKEIRNIIREQKVDIVHVHNTLNLVSPAAYYAALSMGIPVVQTIHNFRMLCPGATFYRDGHICEDCIEHGLIYAVKNSCYRNSRLQTMACVVNTKIHRITGIYRRIHYICLTEFNKQKLLNLKQIAPERVFVKPNFSVGNVNTIPYSQRENKFVYVGRLDKLKGIELLLKAWNQIEDDGNNYKLVVCGTGPMEEWCKNYIKLNNMKCIEMMGFVPNIDARQIIASSKALILLSQWYEGFPMTIVEAYSVGTPIIGSNIGNCANLINSRTGIKVGSEKELVAAIHKVGNGKFVFADIQNIFKTCYSEEANYALLTKIYERILKNK